MIRTIVIVQLLRDNLSVSFTVSLIFLFTEIYVWRLAIIILKHKSVKGHTVQRARVLIVCQSIDLQRNEIGLWCMYEATSQTSHVIVIAICPKETPLCICFRICNETK